MDSADARALTLRDVWSTPLPVARPMPHRQWLARHRALIALLVVHAAVLPAWAGLHGHGLWHTSAAALGLVALAGAGSVLRNRTLAASAVSLGLVLAAGLVVHTGDGLTVLHFHFFVIVAALALYQQRMPFVLALVFVIVDHAGMGMLAPEEVYDDAFGLAHPVAAAIVHGVYVLAAAVLTVLAWTWSARERELAEARAEQEAARVRESERHLSALLEHAPSSIYVKDLEGRFVRANREFADLLSCSVDDLVGRSSTDLFGSEVGDRVAEHDAKVFAGEPVMLDEQVPVEGELRTFNTVKFPLRDDDGKPYAIAGITTDISERVAAERALRDSEQRLAQVFERGPVAQVVLRPDGRLLQTNPAFQRLVVHREQELVGTPLRAVVDPDDREVFDALLSRVTRDGLDPAATMREEVRLVRRDGLRRHCQVSLAGVAGADGALAYLVGMVEDVTYERLAAAELAHQATHDGLTGMPNRALLLERVTAALAQPGRTVAILFLDLDGFKEVNDSLGHDAGDRLLTIVAGRLDPLRRPGDTLARLGGDEFVLCLPDVPDEAAAVDVAERVLAALRPPVRLPDRTVEVRGSIGVALGTGADGATPILMLRDADTALYAAKNAGRDRVVVFEPAMRERDERRRRLQADLARALDGEPGLHLVFQPIEHAASRRIVAAEALLRWEHPIEGLLLPEEFLPLADARGLLPTLDRWVLHEASRVAASWPASVSVTVNMTPGTVAHGSVAAWAADTCESTGLPPRRLVVELTETAVVEHADETSVALSRLRALGVRVALDDFGTGFSSLSLLRDLPVDIVKIDRSFTTGSTSTGRDAAIVRATVDLASALGAELVAEGVEDDAQRAAVAAAGCQNVQGWLVSRPLAPHDLRLLLERDVAQPPLPRSAPDVAVEAGQPSSTS